MKAHRIRETFLDYFISKGHKYFSSDSLVPANDPTLLFTGAGMNQFKPYFLGLKTDVPKATSVQKCIRTADLENVGKTKYHHTFFEMLGNFSFGNYFKEEAIQLAWKFVTQELKLSPSDIWVSVYHDDDQAFNIWKKKIGLSEKRIVRFGAEDNFWPSNAPTIGPNGPCGPCSEIYFGKEPGKGVEIWNLVFTEFDRQDNGLLKPLPQKNIDTGMGLERLCTVMQGVESNFDIDLFVMLLASIEQRIASQRITKANAKIRNAILDHIRAIVFSISDGVLPSNEGRGYVIRKLIRKASLHLKSLGFDQPTLYKMSPAVADAMADAYPELNTHMSAISKTILKEEEAIWSILENRVPEAQIKIKSIALSVKPGQEAYASMIATKKAFEFYDTYGVPSEILEAIVEENHLVFDVELFENLMEEQRTRSRAGSNLSGNIFSVQSDVVSDMNLTKTIFVGYEKIVSESKVVALIHEGKSVPKLEHGQQGILIVNQTPFYAESGGQVGDIGTIVIHDKESNALVSDTKKVDDVILHHVSVIKGTLHLDCKLSMHIDFDRRNRIAANHTATHLLHSALGKVLGNHVKQRGSLVTEDRLRFDFSHQNALTSEEISAVEQLVNREIKNSKQLHIAVKSKKEAMASGAVAFFGDKYGDVVRIVTVDDFSKELCGGTHVANTNEIALFRIVSENSIQLGVRRIEAVTSTVAFDYDNGRLREIEQIESFFNQSTSAFVSQGEKKLLMHLESLSKRLKNKFNSILKAQVVERIQQSVSINGVKLSLLRFDSLDKTMIQLIADWATDFEPSIATVIVSSNEHKPIVAVALSSDLVARGMHAGNAVKVIAASIEGSGGGKPHFAMGGGVAGQDVLKALECAKILLGEELNKL